MTKSLRKRHLQVWMAWAILVPAGIIFAWLVIPDTQPVKLLQSPTVSLLPIVKKTSDKRDYTINLRTTENNSEWQLEWKNKTVLTVPSAVIYKVSPDQEGALTSFDTGKATLIGRIEAMGDYVFSLPPDSTGYKELKLVLYDFIHQRTIEYINF